MNLTKDGLRPCPEASRVEVVVFSRECSLVFLKSVRKTKVN